MNARDAVGHNTVVRKFAEQYQGQVDCVEAHVDGWERPRMIGDRVPDLILYRGGKQWIIEVEMADSAESNHAQEQHVAFEIEAMRDPDRVFFHTFVVGPGRGWKPGPPKLED